MITKQTMKELRSSIPGDTHLNCIGVDIETTGLNPVDNRVNAAAFYGANVNKLISLHDECLLIYKIWNFIRTHEKYFFVGFNIWNYDLEFLWRRSDLYHIVPCSLKRRTLDLRHYLCKATGSNRGTLDVWSKRFGLRPYYSKYKKRQAVLLWQQAANSQLRRLLMDDAILAYQITKKIFQEKEVANGKTVITR